MGMYQYFYIGPYLKIWHKKIKYEVEYKTCVNKECSNYGRRLSSKYCDQCGSFIDERSFEKERPINMYDVVIRCFGDREVFRTANLEEYSKDFVILIPNVEGLGGIFLDSNSYGEIPLPNVEIIFDTTEWSVMIKTLTKDNFKFDKKVGIIAYYK